MFLGSSHRFHMLSDLFPTAGIPLLSPLFV